MASPRAASGRTGGIAGVIPGAAWKSWRAHGIRAPVGREPAVRRTPESRPPASIPKLASQLAEGGARRRAGRTAPPTIPRLSNGARYPG